MLELKFNEKYNSYDGAFESDRGPAKIHINEKDGNEAEAARGLAGKILTWSKENEMSIYDMVATNGLVKLKNTTWLEEGEEKIT